MTTDARALIAEWVRQEESFDNPASTVEYGRAQNWIRTNLSTLLTGYSAALDEVDRHAEDVRIAAGECLVPVDEMPPRSHLRRVVLANRCWRYERDEMNEQIATLRTELGEAKLVIEQQDRDLARLHADLAASRDMVRHYEQERDSWPLAYRQRAAQTDKRIAELEVALRKIHDDAVYDQNHERYLEIADILEGDQCTTTK